MEKKKEEMKDFLIENGFFDFMCVCMYKIFPFLSRFASRDERRVQNINENSDFILK